MVVPNVLAVPSGTHNKPGRCTASQHTGRAALPSGSCCRLWCNEGLQLVMAKVKAEEGMLCRNLVALR